MRFKTRNTLYTLTDAGDGAFFISGHAVYCPKPRLVILAEPVAIGKRVRFEYCVPNALGRLDGFTTTAVQEILP